MQTALDFVTQYGAVSLFLLMMLGIIGLPIPDERLEADPAAEVTVEEARARR